MENETETEMNVRLGMEDGFESSPMARLVWEYSGDTDDLEGSGIPTETNVNLVLDVAELSSDMVIDRGLDRDKELPRYYLDNLSFDRISVVVTEQQFFLEQAAGLIAERTNYFKIDPGNTLLPILKGTSSLAQLRAAWLALRHRIELGTKAWKKYIAEYQLPAGAKPSLSPLSTLLELYQPLQDMSESDAKLRYLYGEIPHHKEQLTEEGKRALDNTQSWLDILPMPDVLRNAFLDSKTKQLLATATKEVKKGTKGKERELEAPSRPAAQSSVWMGMDTPFKSANAWFVDPGKSNRTRQPGTSRPPTEPNILLGIATPLPPQTMKGWEGREQPPHMTDQPQVSDANKKTGRAESRASSRADQRQSRAYQRGRKGNGDNPDEPSSSDDDDSSFGSRQPRRSCSRRRRSRTPRPRRRRSSTPRPARRSPPDDDGGDESGGSSDTSYYSSSASTYSGSRRHRRRRSKDSVVIPYGRMAPTIDPKLKQEDLPAWDGNPDTAIEYFWKVQQQATLGGHIPTALGYWLWLKLKEGSDVQNWFATLPFEEQSRMRGHWVDYLKGIKEGYLGRNWQFDIGEAYKAQYFRQPGHEKELPKSFIARRIMYTRMLAKSDDGGTSVTH